MDMIKEFEKIEYDFMIYEIAKQQNKKLKEICNSKT